MKQENIKAEKMRLIDPDPMSIFLSVLGAVGSVASIISYLEQRKERTYWSDKYSERKRAQLIEAVADIESNLTQIEGQIQKLKIFIQLYGENSKPINRRPFRFGEVKIFFHHKAFQEFGQLHVKTTTLTTKVVRSVYNALNLIDELGIEVDKGHFKRLIELQSELNLAISGDTSYEQAIDLNIKVIDMARDVANRMREDFGLEPSPDQDSGVPRW
ncbi:MAG: hypothetical protein EG822_15515 [Deltaproteobacteria bacterium]|nr:hypothetical protein [Deltaproteobacteria bacterium]TLN02594.1 MAG: hypothetical protein FDZ73_11190 [bacterium]